MKKAKKRLIELFQKLDNAIERDRMFEIINLNQEIQIITNRIIKQNEKQIYVLQNELKRKLV